MLLPGSLQVVQQHSRAAVVSMGCVPTSISSPAFELLSGLGRLMWVVHGTREHRARHMQRANECLPGVLSLNGVL
jgi:hypothetical protein